MCLLLARDRYNLSFAVLIHHFLHEANVVILRKVPVFEQVRTFMGWHSLNKMVDNFVGDERVSKIELRDVWLLDCQSSN